jgi:hypothetical protein
VPENCVEPKNSDESIRYVAIQDYEIRSFMQYRTLSTIVLSNLRRWLAVLALGGVWAACADEGMTLSMRADRPEILMGEPLMVALTVVNNSKAEVVMRSDVDAPTRVLIAPDGARAERTPPVPAGDMGYFFQSIAVGSKDTFRFVIAETAELGRPGQYRLILEYSDLHASGELQFTVKLYDQVALRARASELYRSVAVADPYDVKGGLYEIALAGIDPAVARPFLCDILKLNRDAQPTVLRIEQIADEESVGCLIDALPASRGLHREVIVGALTRLIRRAPDSALKERTRQALQQQ